MPVTDFTTFANRSKYAAEINAGYSARLAGTRLSDNPHMVWVDGQVLPMGEKALAWQHGWRQADRDEKGKGGAR